MIILCQIGSSFIKDWHPHSYNYISNGLAWFFYSPNGFWPIIIVIEGNKNKCLNNFLINTSDSSKMDVGELEYRHKLLVLTKKKEELCDLERTIQNIFVPDPFTFTFNLCSSTQNPLKD